MPPTPEPWPARWTLRRDRWVRPRRVTRAAALDGIAAPAKLNLGLVVTGRRTDGYHKLITLMAALDLADVVRVEPARAFSIGCDDPNLATDDNLVLRAAQALQAATGVRDGARITLTKRVPIAAGLGGGSGDAAATLVALDALWGITTPDDVLLRIARRLGADVPFALYGGAMIARGIGDVLMPVIVPETWLVLVVPRVTIPRKTVALYAALDSGDFDDGTTITRQSANLRGGKPLDLTLLSNTFLDPLERLAPIVREMREAIVSAGMAAFLSGSGPTLYIICAREDEARERARSLRALLDAPVIVTRAP